MKGITRDGLLYNYIQTLTIRTSNELMIAEMRFTVLMLFLVICYELSIILFLVTLYVLVSCQLRMIFLVTCLSIGINNGILIRYPIFSNMLCIAHLINMSPLFRINRVFIFLY